MSEASYWAVLTAPILESTEVTDGAKLFYAQVSRLTNVKGYCWASNRELSEVLHVTKRSVTRYVAELERAGFIASEFVGVKDRKRRGERHIRLAVPAPFKVDKNVYLNIDKNVHDKVDKNVYDNKDDKSSNKITPYNPPQGDERADYFENFWERYPKKRNKAAARRAWDKLAPDEQLCRVMGEALRAQMRSEEWQRDGGRYIPYPASWINGRRWEDEEPLSPQATAPSKAPSKRWVGTKIVDGEEVDVYE